MRFNLKERGILSSAFYNEDDNVLLKHEKKYINENNREKVELVREWGDEINFTFSVGD